MWVTQTYELTFKITQRASMLMPRRQTSKILERKNEVLEYIKKRGEVSTNDIVKDMKLSHSQVFYVLRLLQKDGLIKEIKRGKVAYWKIVEQGESESTEQ